jgi:hypothetical protein
MSTALTMIVSVLFAFRSFNLLKAYFLFVFLIPLFPAYIGIGVGAQGFSLSLLRILLSILFAFMILFFIQRQEYFHENISLAYLSNKNLITVMILFFLLKVFSLIINSTEIALYIKLFNDFLFSIFIFSLTILFVDSTKSIHNLMKMIFYSYTIVLALVLIESVLRYPLLSVFISDKIQLTQDFSEGLIRDDRYRTNGSFLNPILLGEFLVTMIPIVVAYINTFKYSSIFKSVYIVLFLYAIYSTGSRSAMLLSLCAAYLYIMFIAYRSNPFTRVIANLFNVIIISVVLYFIYNYVNDLIMNFNGRFDIITDKEERSSTARVLQFSRVFDKMQGDILFGLGKTRNFAKELEGTIDNYYLWTFMEVGIVGMSCYFLFIYLLLKEALAQYKLPQKNYYLLPVIISMLISILYLVLNVNPANHVYLYIFSGLICTMKILQNKNRKLYLENQSKSTKTKLEHQKTSIL